MMDRIKGWFWKNSSSDDIKQSSEQPADQQVTLNKTNTNDSKNNDTNVNNSSNSSSKPLPVLDEDISDIKKLFVRLTDTVTTKAEKIIPWLEANTQLQPEDHIPRKLLSSTCATLLYYHSVKLSIKQYRECKNNRAAVLISQLCCVGMLAIYLDREWRVALSEPPGENPRSFVSAMAHEYTNFDQRLQGSLPEVKEKGKED